MDEVEILWGRGFGASSPDSSIKSFTSAKTIENSFVTVFYQYGIFGILSFFAILIRFLYVSIRFSYFDKSLSKFALAFLVFFLGFSIGNDFIRNSPFSLYFWFFYAYFEQSYLLAKNNKLHLVK